jgi:hypothetical protein
MHKIMFNKYLLVNIDSANDEDMHSIFISLLGSLFSSHLFNNSIEHITSSHATNQSIKIIKI